MVIKENQKIVAYLEHLGFEKDKIAVYLFLVKNGGSSVLEISKGLKSGRTKLYPILEELALKQLVTIHERHYGSTYEASPPSCIEFLVNDLEAKTQALKISLPFVVAGLEQLRSLSPQGSRVVEYKGIDGLKQMNFNLTKANGEFRVFELANLENHTGMPRYFVEKLRTIWTDKKITSYDLTNNKNWKVDTSVKGYSKFSKARYIDPAVFKINFESYIYNNCLAILSYDKKDIFGVEIHNSALAEQQKQLFDLIWGMGEELIF